MLTMSVADERMARDAFVRYLRKNSTSSPDADFMRDFIAGYVKASLVVAETSDDPRIFLATNLDVSHAYREGYTMCIDELDKR